MASVISEKSKDRQSLSVYRSLGSTFASAAISVVAPLFIYQTDTNGNQVVEGSRFTIVAGIFSILAVVCYLLCYALVTERVSVQRNMGKQKKDSVAKTLAHVISNKALLAIDIDLHFDTLCSDHGTVDQHISVCRLF